MTLTGKANKDFESWLQNRNCNLFDMIRHRNIDQLVVSAYIIEWLDSVGIYINITPLYIGHEDRYSQGLFYSTLCFKDGRDTLCVDYDSKAPMLNRKEVTEMAIQKANDIFNETR